eukprot:gb/GECG01003388.1/.p1 GENE.gb/GECG01003388.1/~~gb/GECG01003388.1/.p1  ORF type:complete len:298 (+),score=13.39 gb/GECG01003388.1/:1-894(+)
MTFPSGDASSHLSDMAMDYANKILEARRRWKLQLAACTALGLAGLLAAGWLWSMRHYAQRPFPRSSLTITNEGKNNSEWGASGNRVLIHIGKTGGMTVRTRVTHWIDYEVHVSHKFNYGTHVPAIEIHEFHPKPNDRLIITVRDPIKRVISAWNFRKYLTNNNIEMASSRCSICEERQCFAFFSSISELAEALPHDPLARGLFTEGCIQHLKHNYTHYIHPIEDFIRNHPEQIEIIRQEHMEEDLRRVFHVKHTWKTHTGPTKHKTLSDRGEQNLREFLRDEYRIYLWLLSLKGLKP